MELVVGNQYKGIDEHGRAIQIKITGFDGLNYFFEVTKGDAQPYNCFMRNSSFAKSLAQADEIKPSLPNNGTKSLVNHPSHYTAGKVECIDAMESAVTGLIGFEAVCTANAIKYLFRWKRKDGVQDLEKAVWYVERLIKKVTEKQHGS